MAKRTPADDDLGFIPDETLEFTPEQKMAAGGRMGVAAFPTMKSKEEDLGFIPYAPDFLDQEGTPVTLEEIGQTAQDVVTTLPQGISTWMDEIQAAAQAAGKKALGEEMPLPDIYREDVQKIREKIGAARARSPWATTIGETAVGVGTALIPGTLAAKGLGTAAKVAQTAAAGKFGGIGGMALRGAFEGAGTSETMDPFEMGTFAGIGGAMGAAGGLATKGLKAITTQSPERIRAGVLGAKTSQFKEIGLKEREKLAKEMADLGLFQKTKAEFDAKSGKWVSKGSALENIEMPVREKLLERIDDAFEKTQEQKMLAIGDSINKVVDQEVLEKELDKVVNRYARKRTGREQRLVDANQVKQDILNDILDDVEESGAEGITVGVLEKAKQRLQADVGGYGKDPLLAKIPDAANLFNDMYTVINSRLRTEIQDKTYEKANILQSKLYTLKGDLKGAMAAESPTFKPTDVTTWFSSPESQADVARAAEVMNLPGLKQLKRPLPPVTSEAPFSAIRFLDPSTTVPYSPDRSPQGSFEKVKPAFPEAFMPGAQYIAPKDLIQYKIPRSSQGILENKQMVIAKLVQNGVPSDLVDTIVHALNKDPDSVSKITPLIISQFPTLFERAKYNTFDGKFLGGDGAKAADDISKRDDLNSIQRAKMIDMINKSNKVPEGL